MYNLNTGQLGGAIGEVGLGIVSPEFDLLTAGRFLATASIKAVSSIGRQEGGIIIQFGKTENQIYHTFRHTDALGLDKTVVKSAIGTHLKTV